MATAAQIKALVSSHAEGDNQRFLTVALQVAAQAARHGHTKFARELRDIVDQAKANESIVPRVRPVPIRQPRGELAGLMSVTYPKLRLGDMVLANVTRNRIERVLLEQRQRDRLREHSFEPLRKLLLVGPPGTGKTMTAGTIAGELGIPLFTIQLHSLITKYMGETASKLRLIFDAMETRAVFFFDEFDAFGSERSLTNDVGEIKRVLNSFLLFLEQDESESLVVAATNYHEVLDRALFRRFDSVIEYMMPDREISGERDSF